METGTETLNIIAILVFLGLSALSALVILLAGRIMFRKYFNYFVLFLSSIGGGIAGIIILYFGSKLEEVKADTSISSIGTLILMVAILLLAMMIAFPLMTLMLRQRRHRIKEMEEEMRKLRENKQ